MKDFFKKKKKVLSLCQPRNEPHCRRVPSGHREDGNGRWSDSDGQEGTPALGGNSVEAAPRDSASPWQLLSAGLKSEWEQRWLGLSLTPARTLQSACATGSSILAQNQQGLCSSSKNKKRKTAFPITAERGRLPDAVCKDGGLGC